MGRHQILGAGHYWVLGSYVPGELELVGMRKLKMYALRPDRDTGYTTYISDSLENLQSFVGGYIEVVRILADVAIICNEDGLINSSSYCCTICGQPFFGPVLIVGVKGEEFTDLPELFQDVKQIRKSLGVK